MLGGRQLIHEEGRKARLMGCLAAVALYQPATRTAGFMHLCLSLTSLHDDGCSPLSCGGNNGFHLGKRFLFRQTNEFCKIDGGRTGEQEEEGKRKGHQRNIYLCMLACASLQNVSRRQRGFYSARTALV